MIDGFLPKTIAPPRSYFCYPYEAEAEFVYMRNPHPASLTYHILTNWYSAMLNAGNSL